MLRMLRNWVIGLPLCGCAVWPCLAQQPLSDKTVVTVGQFTSTVTSGNQQDPREIVYKIHVYFARNGKVFFSTGADKGVMIDYGKTFASALVDIQEFKVEIANWKPIFDYRLTSRVINGVTSSIFHEVISFKNGATCTHRFDVSHNPSTYGSNTLVASSFRPVSCEILPGRQISYTWGNPSY